MVVVIIYIDVTVHTTALFPFTVVLRYHYERWARLRYTTHAILFTTAPLFACVPPTHHICRLRCICIITTFCHFQTLRFPIAYGGAVGDDWRCCSLLDVPHFVALFGGVVVLMVVRFTLRVVVPRYCSWRYYDVYRTFPVYHCYYRCYSPCHLFICSPLPYVRPTLLVFVITMTVVWRCGDCWWWAVSVMYIRQW